MKSDPIRVLHVIDSLAVGGAERVLVDLANTLDRTIVTPAICVTRKADMTLAANLSTDVKIFTLPRQRVLDLMSINGFCQIIRNQAIDVMHAHGYSSSRFVFAAKLFGRLRTPLIMHSHSSDPPGMMTRLVARRNIEAFIGTSPEVVAWGRDLLGLSNTILLGNSVDLQPYSEAQPANIEAYFGTRPSIIALVVANVRPVKHMENLFLAVARSKFRTQLGVMVAGSLDDGLYFQKCQKLLLELELANQVVFLGRRLDVPNLLAAADIGLLSSLRETGPLALLEYMAAGLPFVSTRVGQIGQAVAEAGLPATVPIKDPQSFAAALDTLLDLPKSARKNRGMQGQQYLLNHFNRQDQVDRLHILYRTIGASTPNR